MIKANQLKELKCAINVLGFYTCLVIPIMYLDVFGDKADLVFLCISLSSFPIGGWGIRKMLRLAREREELTHQLIMENLNSRVKK